MEPSGNQVDAERRHRAAMVRSRQSISISQRNSNGQVATDLHRFSRCNTRPIGHGRRIVADRWALDWMTSEFDEFQRPYAIVETNDAAERLPLPMAGVVIEGTPQKQEAYYRKLLSLARQGNFVFVISFIHQDYDALWEKIKRVSPELFIAWRDCSLIDENGNARPALQVWKDYFDLPRPN
jgi:hypothetical protein